MTNEATKAANQAAKKATARPGRADTSNGEAAVLAKIAAMPTPYWCEG